MMVRFKMDYRSKSWECSMGLELLEPNQYIFESYNACNLLRYILKNTNGL